MLKLWKEKSLNVMNELLLSLDELLYANANDSEAAASQLCAKAQL